MTTQTQRNRLRGRGHGDAEDPDYQKFDPPVLAIPNPCGALKRLTLVTLRCTKDVGHVGDHGNGTVTWSQ